MGMNPSPVAEGLLYSIEPTVPEDVRLWLEWAGSKLLSMGIKSPYPREPTASWPSFASDFRQAYGYSGHRLKPSAPNRFEIDVMDEILGLPMLVSDINIRRILNARSLVNPISNRYLYSWTKIGFMIHSERRRVVRLHFMGLCEIARKVPLQKAYSFRQTINVTKPSP